MYEAAYEFPRIPSTKTVWKLCGEHDVCLRSALRRARGTPRIRPTRNGVASARIFPNPPGKVAPGFLACGRSWRPSSTRTHPRLHISATAGREPEVELELDGQ